MSSIKPYNSADLNAQLQSVFHLLNVVVDALGNRCDVFCFVAAIISAQSGASSTMAIANSTARLIFECTLLATKTVPSLQASIETTSRQSTKKKPFSDFDSVDEGELLSFRTNMLELRKLVLGWCVDDLCRLYQNKISRAEEAKCSDTYFERGAVTRGPGAPDYSSVLLDENGLEESDRSALRRLMSLIRCTLFLSPMTSQELASFAAAGEEMEEDQRQRIAFCCRYGVDVDDEMLQRILSSPNVTPNTALSIVENLLLRCGGDSAGTVNCRAATVWQMYELAEYSPLFHSDVADKNNSSDDDGSSPSDAEASDMELEQNGATTHGPDKSNLPR